MAGEPGPTMNFATLPPARRFPRAVLQGTAQINAGPGKTFAGEIVQLSQGGAFVTGTFPLPVGAVVELWLLLPKVATPIRTYAKVLYNNAPRGRFAAGTGFAFTAIGEEHLALIARTVERLRFAV